MITPVKPANAVNDNKHKNPQQQNKQQQQNNFADILKQFK